MMETRKILELNVRPVWDELDRVRLECRNFLEERNSSEETKDSLCMIASEILENAIKYGHYTNEFQSIAFKLEDGKEGMSVQSCSPVPSVGMAENLRKLDTIIQWIRSFQSPFQAYLERLKLIASQPMKDNGSGLGLTRIAYEGEAILDFYVNENHLLFVSALQPRAEREQEIQYE
jgi:hypothetical protein